MTYNNKDIFIQRRTSTGTFEEHPLVVQPNSVITTDVTSSLVMISSNTFLSGTGSIDFAISSSHALTASYASNVPDTASYANVAVSASYLVEGANIYLSQSYILANTNSVAPPQRQGQLWWDDISHTYAIDTFKSRLQIGQENYVRAFAGEIIPNGSVVYLNGAITDPHDPTTKLPVAWLALADGSELSSSVVGLSTQHFDVGEEGIITTQGIVNDIDTQTPDFNDGEMVYLSYIQSGSLINTLPPDPYEKVIVGTVLYRHPTIGRILVNISVLPVLTTPYIGMVSTASFTDHHLSGTFTVGKGYGNFCTTPDGRGAIKQYIIPEMAFTASAGLYTQYIMAHYNSGSPSYMLSNDKSHVDDIQVISAFSFIYPDAGDTIGFIDWDSPGTLLANKLNTRVINLYGAQREFGLMINVSGSVSDSRYITVTSGSMWYGVKRSFLTEINTANTAIAPLTLQYHSASAWYSQDIPSGQFINDMIDDGNNLQQATYGSYIVNYVYRTISDTNRTQIVLSKALATLTEAQIFTLPEQSPYFKEFSLLVGRIIVQSGSTIPISVDSAFGVGIPVTVTPQHNDLQNLQGGTSSLNAMEYYHLTANEYTGTGNGIFVRQSGSVITGSISHADTASWALNSPAAVSASHAVQSDSASYLAPGATFMTVSGSNGVPPAYIEPYDYSVGEYYPPFKEGRMFYSAEYNDWVYYTDEPNWRLHIGKEVVWRCHNPLAITLTRGTPVYISGSQVGENVPYVYPAIADGTNRYSDVIGLIRSDITSGSFGYVIQNGVVHHINMGSFAIGAPLFLGTTLGGLTDVEPAQPYESVRIGNCQEAGVNGSIIISPVFKVPPVVAYAGMTSIPYIDTSLNDGTVTISTGSVNLYAQADGNGGVLGYPLAPTTLSLVSGSTNYVIAYKSGSNAIYDLTTNQFASNGTTIVRVAQFDIYNETTASWDVHNFQIGIIGLALANRINNKDIRLYGFQRENGLTLYTTGSDGHFGISEGIIWYGPNSHVLDQFNTTLPGHYTYIFHTTSSNGTASWHQHTSSIYLDGLYDSGSNGTGPYNLDVCAPLSWSVNFVYRIIGTPDEAAIVLSNNQYIDEATAKANATTPSNLPSTIRDQCLLVGRFIVQSGSISTPTIESAFATIFAASITNDHESLLGLLGGGAGGGHYHLGANDYVGTGTGLMVRADKPSFTGATVGHIPYWNLQQQLTLTGSVQIINDQYVMINSASFPDPTNPETLLVSQINTSSANIIGAYSNVNSFSQIYTQNFNTGSEASADIIAANDNGDQYVHYINMGIASSNYNSPTWPWNNPNEGYLMMDGGNLWIGTTTTHSINFFFNNTASTDYADNTGFYLSGSFYGTASYADNATSASHALTASYIQASNLSASYSIFAETASFSSELFMSSSQTAQNSPYWRNFGSTIWMDGYGGNGTGDVNAGTLVFRAQNDTPPTSLYPVAILQGSKDPLTGAGGAGGQVSIAVMESNGGMYERVIFGKTNTVFWGSVVATGSDANLGTSGFTGSLTGNVIGNAITATSASWASSSISSSYVSASYSQINDLSSSTITVNQGAKIGGMSDGLTSVDTIQIGAADVGVPLPDPSYKRAGAVQIGWGAGQMTITASNAVQIGIQAGTNTKLADSAVQIGGSAGVNTITASNAVQIGVAAGQSSVDATNAVQIGSSAGAGSTIAINAIQIGVQAGFNTKTGSNAVQIGSYAGNTSTRADNAVQIGSYAGQNSTRAPSAVQIGDQAGRNSTVAATSAVQIGDHAGYNATNSDEAVQVGAFAGNNARTGSYTTFIGSYADTLDEGLNVEKSIAIGYNAKVSGSNMAVIGGTGADAVNVGIGTDSPQNTLEVVGNIKATSITSSLFGIASNAINSNSASFALTASYAIGIPTIKSGIIAGTSFGGVPNKTASVTFVTPFIDNNYSAVINGESARTWTVENKVSGSFIINSNSTVAFTDNVFWQSIYSGEYYS